MRMTEKKKSVSYWIDYINFLVENNITKIHISKEYNSYSLIIKIFSHPKFQETKKKIDIILKCYSPDFNEKKFNKFKLYSQINQYKIDLGVNKIFAIQWLWRGSLDNDSQRILDLNNSRIEINQFIKTIRNKFAKYILSFPYSEDFLISCKKKINIDGFTIYLNLEEKKFYKYLKYDNFKYITIRPFIKTNKIMRNLNLKKILRLNLKNKKLLGTMISLSKKEEIHKILNIINKKNF